MGERDRPAQGSLLAERYRLGPLQGTSDVCRVFAARDELLERDVAVKTLDGAPGTVALARALRAARRAARIRDPRLIQVLDVVQGDPSFLVLERHRVTGLQVPPNVGERLAVADALLAGLATLHAGRALHRDVRLANVLRSADGRVLLTTTGISAATRDPGLFPPQPDEPEPPALPARRSPEQHAGAVATARSDVFCAGLLLGDLLGDDAGPEVAAVLRRATAADPAARHADAGQLRDALREAAVHRTASRPVEPPAPPPPTPRVQPAPTARAPARARPRAGVVATLLLVAVLGLGLWVRQALTAPLQPAASTPSTPSPAPTPEAVPTVVDVPPVASLSDLLERPDLTPGTDAEAALLAQVRDLEALQAPERGVAAAELLGRTVTGAADGQLSRGFARGLFDVLAAEVTLDGVVVLAERDPASIGPFLDRLRALPDLDGAERAAAAAALFGDVSASTTTGVLPPQLRAVVMAALLPELSLDGVITLADRDPALAGAGPFADRLRALRDLELEQRGREAADLIGQADTGDLAPSFRATVTAVLLFEVTLDGVVALAERNPATMGPDATVFAERLRVLRDLDGEQRGAAATQLLADVDAGAPGTDLSPTFRAVAAQVLRPLMDGTM